METKIDPVDPGSMHEVLENTHGDWLSRTQQIADLFKGGDFTIAGALNRQRRLKAFFDLLAEHPELKRTYSEKALITACAICELIEPPMNLVGGDETMFNLAEFERVAATAEL